MPRTQIYDVNATSDQYAPSWASNNVVLTPSVYLNQKVLEVTGTGAPTIQWLRRDGAGDATTTLVSGETVNAKKQLVVNKNVLGSSESGVITYILKVSYTDPDTTIQQTVTSDITFNLARTGTNGTNGSSAKSISVSGDQVFKYPSGSDTPSNTSVVLTATVQNTTLASTDAWKYYNPNSSASDKYDSCTSKQGATISGNTITITYGSALWTANSDTLKIRAYDASGLYDDFTIYKIHDGINGQPGAAGSGGVSVFLDNESISFAADKNGNLLNATAQTCYVVGYIGTEAAMPTLGAIATNNYFTITPTDGTGTNNKKKLITITPKTISGGNNCGSANSNSGTFTIPVTKVGTTSVSINLVISWTKINTGLTGNDGANSVVFTIYGENGTEFRNGLNEKSGTTLTIKTQAYEGASAITSGASYQWSKYVNGSWTGISGAESSSYTVNADDVAGLQSYQCKMTYKNNNYYDVITIVDKTDNVQAQIDSTLGDVFKNSIGETYLICRIWRAAEEIDTVKTNTFSTTAPASPSDGDMYYTRASATQYGVVLKKRSGNSWSNVTDTYQFTYKWYGRDKDGNPIKNPSDSSSTVLATGKVMYVSSANVNSKAIFTCEVE